MSNYVLIIMLAYIAFGAQLKQRQTSNVIKRIVGGKVVTIAEFPYLVNIWRDGNFKCGGSLISPNCVLTAAHCLENQYYVHNLEIHASQTCHSEESQMRRVRQAIVALQYNGYFSLDMDIAVLQLETPYAMEQLVQIIDVDYRSLKENDTLIVAGWGDTGSYFWNRCLMVTNSTVISRQKCCLTNCKWHPVTMNMFCAIGADNEDACRGDSGGPIMRDGKQVGIVSWGYGCGIGYPGVYTRLSSRAVARFLRKTIKCYCQ